MHELNICLSLIGILENHTSCDVKKIWVEIGELSGIDLEAFLFSFPIAATGTIAAHAELEVIKTAGLAKCYDCNNNFSIENHFNACPQCNGYNYKLTQGKELKIIKMELV